MAQTEDTELRDLVIEALEKNGSLAKIRALLRANIFLAFEDECENLRQNVHLDNILKLPEGILALSVVHEFLEFCSLKNTLFVYMAESRQGKVYNYEGKKSLADKLNVNKMENIKEPVLLTLLKKAVKPYHKIFDQFDNNYARNQEKNNDNGFKDDQNNTYIVHEDSQSSTTSNTQSDNSSDEKNKLHLRLQLDNSDTDTSSDSTRDKSSSEYIPNQHEIKSIDKCEDPIHNKDAKTNLSVEQDQEKILASRFLQELKTTVSSSDSTSYVELKPFSSLEEKLLNTTGVPIVGNDEKNSLTQIETMVNVQKETVDSTKSATLSPDVPLPLKQENIKNVTEKRMSVDSAKSEPETDYSYDFSSSQKSKSKDTSGKELKSPELSKIQEVAVNKDLSMDSPHQMSQSSQSSISISDVADLISEKSSSFGHPSKKDKSISDNKSHTSSNNQSKKKSESHQIKLNSDDSGDFTESPIPSLSNLSLDIHSD